MSIFTSTSTSTFIFIPNYVCTHVCPHHRPQGGEDTLEGGEGGTSEAWLIYIYVYILYVESLVYTIGNVHSTIIWVGVFTKYNDNMVHICTYYLFIYIYNIYRRCMDISRNTSIYKTTLVATIYTGLGRNDPVTCLTSPYRKVERSIGALFLAILSNATVSFTVSCGAKNIFFHPKTGIIIDVIRCDQHVRVEPR